MALSQNMHVYMETVEETKDQGGESHKNGSAKRLGMASWKQPPWTLVHNTYSCRKHGDDKRKTDKQWHS